MVNEGKEPEASLTPPSEVSGPSEQKGLLEIIQQQRAQIEELRRRVEVSEAAQKALQEKVDQLLQQLRAEQEKHQKDREEKKELLAEMGSLEKATQFAGWGLGKLEHPTVRRDEQGRVKEGKEPYEDLKEQYGEILLREIEKMERRKPLPWDNWRALWLIDFIEQIRVNEEIIKEIGPEEADKLSTELMEYFEMREAIWNRICWHERSLGYIKVICAEDSPRPTGEELAEFENDPFRPEVRAAIEVFLDPRFTAWFIDEEGNVSTPYTDALKTAGSEKDFYQAIESAIIQKTEELTGGKVTLSRSRARRARIIAEDYLKAVGFISTLDPAMKRNINDQLNEAMFGGTRNRERTDQIKPTGPAYGAGLFVDRLVYPPGERDEAFEKTFERFGRDPLILLEGNLAGETQYMGSLYHQITVEAKISPDGRFLILSRKGILSADAKTRAFEQKEVKLEIPLEGIGIRGKPLATQEVVIEVEGEKKKVKVAEEAIRGKKVNLRLIDLMTNLNTGEIKPLPREIWQFLDNQVFGGLLLGWTKAGELGFYGLTCKPGLGEIKTYSALQSLYHTVRGLMSASPFFNVLTEGDGWLLVKINRRGEIFFGSKLNELEEEVFSRKEVHELIMARLIALGASVLSIAQTLVTPIKEREPTSVVREREEMLTVELANYLFGVATQPPMYERKAGASREVLEGTGRMGTKFYRDAAESILTTKVAVEELSNRLSLLAVWRQKGKGK